MIQLLPRRDTNIEIIIPVNTTSALPTAGVSWAWGNWLQIIAAASLTYPFLLCGVEVLAGMIATGGTSNVNDIYEGQIGIGDAASEVPIASFGDSFSLSNPSPNTATIYLANSKTHLLEPIIIPASTRIAVRLTQSLASNLYGFGIHIIGYNWSTFSPPVYPQIARDKYNRFIKGTMTDYPQILPSAAPVTVTSGTPAWAYGSWAEMIASASDDTLIMGINYGNPSTFSSRGFQAYIGIGAAGSEVTMAKIGAPAKTIFPSAIGDQWLPRPLYVKAGERVAISIASGFASLTWGIQLKAYELK
ncbi:MAG: hypothetical protein A2Z52_00895 [Candidatus Moranbacteria bacterium RBG_19FT_COMBO_42_6]|nr:MAG: hypothetical protein A2Z52_00895 [Candidatus Moranbacteria bacterium RBG_19FT_COMBO_42_6]